MIGLLIDFEILTFVCFTEILEGPHWTSGLTLAFPTNTFLANRVPKLGTKVRVRLKEVAGEWS